MNRTVPVSLLAIIVGWGCGPPAIVPVAPPGLAYRPSVSKDEPAAEAIGETRTAGPDGRPSAITPITPAEPTALGETKTTEEDLVYETLAPGDGTAAKAGDLVYVHYTGTLTNGSVFDSSREGGRPFEFVIGKGGVIKGWDLGITGMKVGEKRKLTIPPELGYGNNSPSSKIPPNSTLLFEVELVGIE